MQIHGFPIALDYFHHPAKLPDPPIPNGFGNSNSRYKFPLAFGSNRPISTSSSQLFVASSSSKGDSGDSSFNDGDLQQLSDPEPEPEPLLNDAKIDGIEVEIEKLSNIRRRIRSKIVVEASLQTIWGILTDYDRLADFIPGLVVSQVIDKRENFARLLQIGQQNLAFGLKFNARGIVDCYEKDYESLPNGERRDIEFKMIEGDFELFEGKWSIEQSVKQSGSVGDQQYHTTLTYTVDVQPKMWLPVQLVEGRLCREIKMNLFCIQQAAQNSPSGKAKGKSPAGPST